MKSRNGQKLFGTDGVRGRVGEPPITPDSVLKLGWAAGRVMGGGNGGKIVIGKDTRVSGYLLESALEAGLSSAGMNISLIGPMPTPGIAYLTRTARARAGIVISASHNPYYDNGIKFFLPDGSKLPSSVETDIERLMDEPMRTVSAAKLGKAERFPGAPGRYIEYCKSTVPSNLSLSGLKLVVDCANGASYHIAPSVFEELGAEVIAVGVEPDGFNINENCGSTEPEFLQRLVAENHADVGIALDGDGDRVVMVDENAKLLDGDRILYIMISTRLENNLMRGGVVGTSMTNLGLELACRQKKIPFERVDVGDRYIHQKLRKNGWVLGGEPSGHILCLDKSSTGDGIIAALDVLEAMVSRSRRLSELAIGMEKFPQANISVPLADSKRLPNEVIMMPIVQEALRKVEQSLGSGGRVVLRPSGTEPVIRVMVEGKDKQEVAGFGQQLANVLTSIKIGS
ncbi:MAG: phosphoglucosamine mutase [Acidiferrobacteraceae bacterium]|nr:phosphoglucosamine mutase [Acidiferrobacteraceae bacterium]